MFKNFTPDRINRGQISNLKSHDGFTLLEIMVAVAVLSGLIITIIISLNYHLSIVDMDKDATIATLLAREKMEEIKIQGIPDRHEGDFAPRFQGFHWRYDTEEVPIKGIQKIYLTVSWAKGEKVSMETYDVKK